MLTVVVLSLATVLVAGAALAALAVGYEMFRSEAPAPEAADRPDGAEAPAASRTRVAEGSQSEEHAQAT